MKNTKILSQRTVSNVGCMVLVIRKPQHTIKEKIMEIIKSYKTEVIHPGGLPLIEDKDGIMKPWCEPHGEFYYKCNCPKPDSTPEKDGWEVTQEGKILYASPIRDIYEAMALWIEVRSDIIKCNRCGKDLDINDYSDVSKMLDELPYLEMLDTAVDAFFDIHAECCTS